MDVLRLTLRQLQIFVAVARAGTTTAAAQAIALSQSATSSAVNELERLLSTPLFDRVGKRLLLNENGRALLPRALAMLDGAAEIERLARSETDPVQALRIGASTTIGNYVLPALLATFLAQRHRKADAWESMITVGNTGAICRAVAEFELDVGLIEGPCHEPALTVHPWVHDELVIVAAAHGTLLASHPGVVDAATLADQVWLLREAGSGTREATDQILLPYLGPYRRSIALGSSEAIKHAAAADLGLACLSRWVVADLLAAGKLAQVQTDLPPFDRACHIVVHRDKQATPALRELLTHAAALGQQ